MAVSDIEDEAIRRLREELERVIARIERDLRRRLASGDRSETSRITMAAGLEIADDLARRIEQMSGRAANGFRALASEVLDAIGPELARDGIAPTLTAASETTLLAQLGTTLDDIAAIGGESQARLREIVVEKVRSSASTADLVDALAGELGTSAARALTLVDTGAMGLDRAVVLAQASESGFEWFGYSHPLDGITRPWCARHAGKRYTAQQIAQMRNDTGPQPPAVYGGGYHCRGRWEALDGAALDRWPVGEV